MFPHPRSRRKVPNSAVWLTWITTANVPVASSLVRTCLLKVRTCPHVLRLYRHAFAFRHPGAVSPAELDEVLPDFRYTAVPPPLVDLLADPLLNPVARSCVSCPGQPVLPDGLPTCRTTFKRYALLETQGIAADASAQAKILKYAPLKEHCLSKGKRCDIYPFVIGSLGSWHPENEKLLAQLGMTSRYRTLFRKLCCADVIQGSCDIYRLHMG